MICEEGEFPFFTQDIIYQSLNNEDMSQNKICDLPKISGISEISMPLHYDDKK